MADIISHNELLCSEFCYKSTVDYSKKPKNDPKVKALLQTVTALMNSSGGLIRICGEEQVQSKILDNWKHALFDQLQRFLPSTCYINCIKLYDDNSSLPQTLHVLIKKSSQLVTLEYNMYTRGFVGNVPVNDITEASVVMTNPPSESDPFIVPQQLVYENRVNVCEGSNVEYKYWNIKDIGVLIKRFSEDRTQRGLLAMPNIPSGGHMVIGVEEDKSNQLVFKGQYLKKSDESAVETAIQEILTKDPTSGAARLWGHENTQPLQGINWNVKFFEIQHCPDNERRVLIHIELKHCPGGVFMRKPLSYIITEDGRQEKLSFSIWRDHVLKETETTKATHKPKDPNPSSQHSSMAISAISEVVSGNVAHPIVERKSNPSKYLSPSPNSRIPLYSVDTLSFTKRNTEWKDYHIPGHKRIQDSVPYIKEIIYSSNPLKFIPDVNTILYRQPVYKMVVEECIRSIQQCHGANRGFVIASSQWVKEICDFNIAAPHFHLMDFMSVDDKCKMKLVALFSKKHGSDAEKQERFCYVRQVARLTKMLILTHERCHVGHGHSLYIEPEIWVPGNTSFADSGPLENVCRRFLSGISPQWEIVQEILGMLLLNKQTTMRRHIGDECLVKLTTLQMEALMGTGVSQFNFIEGPPGSGKTLLALFVCRKFRHDACLFACKNSALQAFVDYQNICKTTLIKADDIKSLTKRSDFSYLECVIIDDCHQLDIEDSHWQDLFRTIHESGKFLFVFMDNHIQNFELKKQPVEKSFHHFISNNTVSHQKKTLSEVHRNTQKVVSYISAGFREALACGHDEEGDDVEMKRVTNMTAEDSNNGLILFIKELITPSKGPHPDTNPYDAKDIAILVDGDKATDYVTFFVRLFKRYLRIANVQRAHKFPIQGTVVDHIDKFSGLDAKVCIHVAPDVHSNSFKQTERRFGNPKYKAFVASRGVYRVIFVTDSVLDTTKADTMYIDPKSLVDAFSCIPDYSSSTVSLVFQRMDVLPWAVAVCPVTGNIVISDNDTSKICCLSPALELIRMSGHKGSKVGGFDQPWGIAIDSKEVVYIADSWNHRIQLTNIMGKIIKVIGREGNGQAEFNFPTDIAIKLGSELYVCDMFNSRIQVLTTNGEYVSQFTLPRPAPGEGLPQPSHIAVNADLVAVSDGYGDVYVLTAAGSPLHTLRRTGTPSSGYMPDAGKFGFARGVSFDIHGQLIVNDYVDGGCLHVLRVSSEHVEGCVIGGLIKPWGIALSTDGNILVCDRGDNSLKLLLVPKLDHSGD